MKTKSGTSKPASKKAAPKMNMGGAVKKKPIGYGKGGMIYKKAKQWLLMLCMLVFVGWNHAWINGSNQLAKYCYYDCEGGKNGSFYDRVYRVAPNYNCPIRIVFA